MNPAARPSLAIVLKGYPRLSETFIAQEIAALEARGFAAIVVSLRHPTDKHRHPVHERIAARVMYLPEYLYQEPLRVLRGWWRTRKLPGYRQARADWLRDLRRDFTPNRGRRFGQACVLAAELSNDIQWLHCHFLHTPASVTRYGGTMRCLKWSGSAHAKDIWTTPDWEIAEKLGDCRFLVTCTQSGLDRLQQLAPQPERIGLVYHGLDFAHLPAAPLTQRPAHDGSSAAATVTILSVGRAVPKKGFSDVLQALALLPKDLQWRFVQLGGGPLRSSLIAQAKQLGLDDRASFIGARPQHEVFAEYQKADLFVLASRIAEDGDRDGLPNVLMEAQSQALACIATEIAAIPELIDDNVTGVLTPPGDITALAKAIERLIRDPALRTQLGAAGQQRVHEKFSFEAGVDRIAALLRAAA
ncbi:MAG: glycosyltransferase family 4 protein [Rhodospirillales bacterium]